MARPRLAKQRLRTRALLLRRVPYRESDCIVTLFTERVGSLGAIAHGLRRSRKRFAGLEPVHLLRVNVDLAQGRELGTLAEAEIERPRLGVLTTLATMDAAGRALRWLRTAAPTHTPEPGFWIEINALLDALDEPGAADHAEALLGAAGLRMLDVAGWGLELRRCVRCEKPCPERARAEIDIVAGGVVCRNCGGGRLALSARQRTRLIRAITGDESALGQLDDARIAAALVEQAFAAHGAEPSG